MSSATITTPTPTKSKRIESYDDNKDDDDDDDDDDNDNVFVEDSIRSLKNSSTQTKQQANEINVKQHEQQQQQKNKPTSARGRLKSSAVIPKRVVLAWKHVGICKEKKSLLNKAVSKVVRCAKRTPEESILDDAAGLVAPGEILAIMGPSGSGKTSLLNALSFCTKSPLVVHGQVMLNGCDADINRMAMVSRYIQQDDLFFGTLTVKEHLTFHAMLRLDSSISREEKMSRVEKVLKEFNLEKRANVKIGIPGRIKGISGGEKRRLAFASEILTDPPLLFCDEPTSGLDSYMAKSIVYFLQKMSQDGKTIICSIHQPSSEIFNIFDKICFLAQSRVAYFGTRSKALEFFSVKLKKECPPYTNPADFYMDVLGLDVNDLENSKSQIIKYCEEFAQSECKTELIDQIDRVQAEQFSAPSNYSPYKSSWSDQLRFLLGRSFKSYVRNHKVVMNEFLMVLLTALLGGFIYFRTGTREDGSCFMEQDGIVNISFALFYTITTSVLYSILAAVMAFPLEIPIYNREHSASVYRSSTYYISKLIIEVPVYVIFPTLHAIIIYFLVGFGCELNSFFVFVLTNIVVSNAAYSLGHILSTASNDVNLAVSLSAPTIAIQMLFSGFFLNKTLRTPEFLIFIKYLSIFNYAYDLLMANQWEHAPNITCKEEVELLCVSNGWQILDGSKIKRDREIFNFGMLLALAILFRLIAYVILWFKGRRKSSRIRRKRPNFSNNSQVAV